MAAHLLFYNRALRRERVFRDRTNPVEVYNDSDLYSKFRLTRHAILELTDILHDEIAAPTLRNHPIPPVLQVCTALRYYATGTFQAVCADLSDISQPSVSRIVHRVSDAVVRVLLPEVVKFPSNQDTPRVQHDFRNIAGFPGVVGIVDGTHIKIQAPTEHEEVFVCRKMYHSINVQVVCDAKMYITDLVVRHPGNTHDARIWRESALGEQFATRQHRGVILGDSGYPCLPWLMTPLGNPTTRAEERYNSALTHTRRLIENVIGVWKRRFHCLHDELRLSPNKACKVIAATAAIHNFAKARHMPDFPDDHPPHYVQPPCIAANEDGNVDGRLARQRLIDSFR